ncbi:MAG: hypothetical protein PVJ67_06200 [Candidatus Pacearchaeota archaeon]|jgi:hypothetical protein
MKKNLTKIAFGFLIPLFLVSHSYAKELEKKLMPKLETYDCGKIQYKKLKVPGTKSHQEIYRYNGKTEIRVYDSNEILREVKFIENRKIFFDYENEKGIREPDNIVDRTIYLK